ncbi:MAG: TIGR02757 family protein, partial [Ignavibacteriales bacterium]
YRNEKDIEVMGFIASIFAYGNVKQINNTLNKFVDLSGNKPYEFITNYHPGNNNIIHRFYSLKDVEDFFILLRNAYSEYGSLKNLFLKNYNPAWANLKEAVSGFSKYFIEKHKILNRKKELSAGIKFMFPLPELGSACKRMNLFLRWMIRKDELDFGLWNEIPTNKLIIPVDTHIARIGRKLNLTRRKNVSWRMAEEITEKLKKFDPDDPVKYDFAICHIGMRKMKF